MCGGTFIRGFLGLLFFGVAGANAVCPLELKPPKVVVKYGDSVSVNCTASISNANGMSWEATVGGTDLKEVVQLVTWRVEKLTEWTVKPQCLINTDNTGTQCEKVLPVILYKTPDSVSISSVDHTGPMVEGSHYQLQCDIENIAPVQYLTVKWYKGQVLVNQTSFGDLSKTPVNESSMLLITPSRADDDAQYSCVAELHLGPEGPQPPPTVTSEPLSITVHFGPESKNCPSHVEVMEGDSLEGHCTFTGNPPAESRWLRDGQPINPALALNRTMGGQYTVSVTGRTSFNKLLMVSVVYGPELTCPSSYSIAEHEAYNLTCTAVGYPVPQLSWFKKGEKIYLPENMTRHDGGLYNIIANNTYTAVNHTLDIDVLYPPSKIAELEDDEGDVGSAVVLKCVSYGNPRPEYRWSYYQTPNVKVKNEDGVSLLYISGTLGYNIGTYTCFAKNKLGEVAGSARVSVRGTKPLCSLQLEPSRVVVRYGEPISAHCKATVAPEYQPKVRWNTRRISNDSTWTEWNLTDWDARPLCNATCIGLDPYHKYLDITLYKTPDSVSISSDGQLVEGRHYQLQCDIQNIAPVQYLTVKWYKGQVLVNQTSFDDLSKTPVNESSTLLITPSRADGGAQYRCVAELHLGPEGPQLPPTVTSEPLNITVHYGPIINETKLPARVPVFRGYPKTLTCEAEGNPQPKINWTFKGKPLLSGANLTITEKTDDNMGLYKCTATNSVGETFREVTVEFNEDYLPLIAGMVAVVVVINSVIFIFIYSIYYKNTKMGNYSLKDPKPNTQKGNVAQNGQEITLPMKRLSQ